MNKIIEIIIEFINACKNNNHMLIIENDRVYSLNSSKYLLDQILRQYKIPNDHWYISKKAKELWDMITDEDIREYTYNDRVVCKNDKSIKGKKYVGNEKNPSGRIDLIKGKTFAFREVFHDEHMVTVSDIINELLSLSELNEKNVKMVLNKIYICKVLKEEDRKLYPKVHRSTDVNDVIKNVYNKCGIEIEKLI